MIAVIGDIHGCYLTLEKLYEQLKDRYGDIDIYCVGDLVDRGNFSFEVIEFVQSQNIIFTPGNHDYMFYYYIKEPANSIGKPWPYNGSESTLKSYHGRWNKIDEHLEMIKFAPILIDHEDCFISHAGISEFYRNKLDNGMLTDPSKLTVFMEKELTSEHSIIWNRDELMNLDKLQVVGHTRNNNVKLNEFNNVLYIDTAAVANNKLTAVIIDKHKLVDTISEKTVPMDVVSTSF